MIYVQENSSDQDRQVCDSGPDSNNMQNRMHSSNKSPLSSQSSENEGISGEKVNRAKTSSVWRDFDEVLINGVRNGKCKYCNMLFMISHGGSISSMKKHKCLSCSSNKKQKLLSFTSDNVSYVTKKMVGRGSDIEPNTLRDLIAKMIVVGDLPFSIMDNCHFRMILMLGFPKWVHVSRETIWRDVMQLYEDEKDKLKETFKSVDKIALTTDTWTSSQQIEYMSLTAHFIDKDWKMQHYMINFCEIEPHHTSVVLANVIAEHLTFWEIKKKVISITLDNASSNDVLVEKLKENMELSGANLYYGGKLFHVQCCAHMLNLMVQDGLSVIKDEIANIRKAIKYLKVSPSRLHSFSAAAKELEVSTTRHLVLDVPTQWNSTYLMLDTALVYKNVFRRYSMEDSCFVWSFEHEDWEKISAICFFLQVFQDVAVLFSGSTYPTASMFLIEIENVRHVLQEKIENGNELLKTMATKMKEKFDKYWNSSNLFMCIASILDPRTKLTLSEFIFSSFCQSIEEKEQQMEMIKRMLQEVYDIYVKKSESHVDGNLSILPTRNQGGITSLGEGAKLFFKFLKESGNVHFEDTKSELESYLEDGLVKFDYDFDVLQWWKDKQTKYQILSQMARDILSIPITSVVSERAFSIGDRVISDNHTSLQPSTVEALLCLKSWIKSYGDPMNEMFTKVNDDLESCEYIHLP